MSPPRSGESKRPVNTRMIAQRVGVSATTVSLALRGHPRISAKMRMRVQRVADELGYRPDPQLAKLMYCLRNRKPAGFQSTIAALTDLSDYRSRHYANDVVEGAGKRAEELGYAFTCIRFEESDGKQRGLERMLRARGVEGLLLLPMSHPQSVEQLVDWNNFSVIASTYGVLAPEFHRVVPNQFGNMLLLCDALVRLGYHRLGLVIPTTHDLTVHHGFSAAVAWQGTLGGTEPVAPLTYATDFPAGVKRWFTREKPDAIIARSARDCHFIARELGVDIPGKLAFAVTSREGQTDLAGMEEHPGEIGRASIDLLHAKLLTGTKGVPTVPMAAMIAGSWVPGASAAQIAGRTRVKTLR